MSSPSSLVCLLIPTPNSPYPPGNRRIRNITVYLQVKTEVGNLTCEGSHRWANPTFPTRNLSKVLLIMLKVLKSGARWQLGCQNNTNKQPGAMDTALDALCSVPDMRPARGMAGFLPLSPRYLTFGFSISIPNALFHSWTNESVHMEL